MRRRRAPAGDDLVAEEYGRLPFPRNAANRSSLHVLPGKYSLTIKVPGQPDQTEELNVGVDETWGLIVLPTGGHFADQLY